MFWTGCLSSVRRVATSIKEEVVTVNIRLGVWRVPFSRRRSVQGISDSCLRERIRQGPRGSSANGEMSNMADRG